MRDSFAQHGKELVSKTIEHFYTSTISLLIAIAVAVPLGTLLPKTKRMANVALTTAGVLQMVPTLAILVSMTPISGVGRTPAVIAPSIYALLSILNNTVSGIQNTDKNIIEVGIGMGMARPQLMKDMELPLALPLITSGIRLLSVYVISRATLMSYINVGGLGDLAFNRLNLYGPSMIISIAILITCLALLTDLLLSLVERWAMPKGPKVSR